MPASSVKEDYFLASATAATRADDPVYSRGAPATRYRVRIVNTSATDRVYVAYSSTEVARTAPYPEVIEADYGVWDAFVDANVQIWVKASGAANVYCRLIQFAT